MEDLPGDTPRQLLLNVADGQKLGFNDGIIEVQISIDLVSNG